MNGDGERGASGVLKQSCIKFSLKKTKQTLLRTFEHLMTHPVFFIRPRSEEQSRPVN